MRDWFAAFEASPVKDSGVPSVPGVPGNENQETAYPPKQALVEHVEMEGVFQCSRTWPSQMGTPGTHAEKPGVPATRSEKASKGKSSQEMEHLEHLEHAKQKEAGLHVSARPEPGADMVARLWAPPEVLAALDFDVACGNVRERGGAGRPFQGRRETPWLGSEDLSDNRTAPAAEASPGTIQPRSEVLAKRRRSTSSMLDNFRAGCAWLLSRLNELLAAGWTSKTLFAVGRLTFPWGWGIAWTSSWTDPARKPELQSDGTIRWEIREAVRVVYQTSRPRMLS